MQYKNNRVLDCNPAYRLVQWFSSILMSPSRYIPTHPSSNHSIPVILYARFNRGIDAYLEALENEKQALLKIRDSWMFPLYLVMFFYPHSALPS
jgi:hypothetical protein